MKLVIVADIHGNHDALRALPEDYDELWVLGDLDVPQRSQRSFVFRVQSDSSEGASNACFKRPVHDCKLLAGGFTSFCPAKNGQIFGRAKQVRDRSNPDSPLRPDEGSPDCR
jgi:hypothetical protein